MINIIAVDDELDAKVLFEHFFKKEVESGKVSMRFAHSAHECLDMLEKDKLPNTLVITDINMPDTDGISLAKQINQEYPGVKLFMVSAYDARSQIHNIQHLNIAEYITKPVNFSALKEKIFEHYS